LGAQAFQLVVGKHRRHVELHARVLGEEVEGFRAVLNKCIDTRRVEMGGGFVLEVRASCARRFLDALLFGETQSRIVISCRATDAIKVVERAKLLGEVFPDGLDFEIFETIAEGDIVALRCTSTGTVFDGRPYRNDYHYQFVFDGSGRIRIVREYMNVQVAAEVIRPAFAEIMRRKG